MLHAAVVDVWEVAVARSIARCGNNPLCLGDSMRECMDVARKSHISMPADTARRFKAVMTADTSQTLRLRPSSAAGARAAFIGGIGPSWLAWNMRLWGVPAFSAQGIWVAAIRLAIGGLTLGRHQALD